MDVEPRSGGISAGTRQKVLAYRSFRRAGSCLNGFSAMEMPRSAAGTTLWIDAFPTLTGVLPNALRSPRPSAWTFCDPCRGRLSLRFCSGGGAPKALATGYPLARLPACSLCERAVIETRNPRVGQQALTHWATEIPPLRGYRPTLGVRRPAPTTHRYARLLGDWREGLVVDR